MKMSDEVKDTENDFNGANDVVDTDSGALQKMAKMYKRIYNPLTRRYYKAEVNPDGTYTIVGLWSPPKKRPKKTKKKRKKEPSIWDVFN